MGEHAAAVVAPGFEPVAEAFESNFAQGGEVGAAFAATLKGELVVDVWGGLADQKQRIPWQRNTLQVIFSGSKGLVAICMLMLIERGDLALDTRVSEVWPEFAAADKQTVTIRELVTHTARLPGFEQPLNLAELTDDHHLAALLAAQPQATDPRAVRCYHPLTYGSLCGEVVRRVDGRSIGRFFAEEVAEPLGLEIYLGLPAELETRVSRLELLDGWVTQPRWFDPAQIASDSLARSVWINPPFFDRDSFPWNSRRFHAAEIPGSGGIGTARSMATLYGSLDALLAPETIALATSELERRVEGLSPPEETVEEVFGVGFALQGTQRHLGPPPDAFGHLGAGGSTHGCWPSQEVGFSYAMNLMRDDCPSEDPRPGALLAALYDCVTGVARATSQ